MLKSYKGLFVVVVIFYIPLCNCGDYRKYFKTSTHPIQTWRDLKDILVQSNFNPISYLTTPQVITRFGYPVEVHKVVTSDGYILTLHRIPCGKVDRTAKTRPVVFLQHGIFGASFEWFLNKEDSLLPLKLADAGYDVWLGNTRGNTYSRGHVTMTVKNSQFWEFSLDEIGKNDVPAVIDYALKTSGESKLHYVGFSMGTTMFWIMMSHYPEYNAKVKLMVALAPVVYLNNMLGPPKALQILETTPGVKDMLQSLGNGEFPPTWMASLVSSTLTKMCSNTFLAETFCTNLIFLMMGWDLPQVSINQVPVFFGHVPAPTSLLTGSHLLQFMRKGVFRQYDYGNSENKLRYGKIDPPTYSLQNTTIPVALIYGPSDAVVNPVDVKRLAGELPNVILSSPVNFTLWNHFDYHLGKDANSLVHERVMKLLAKY